MTESSEEKRPRRGRRFFKILLILVVVMLIVLALLPTLASTGMGRSWTEGRLADTLHRDVTLGDFSAGWGSGVEMTDLVVKNPSGFSSEPLLRAGTVLLKPGLWAALGGRLDVDLALRNATLRVETDAEGRTNTDGMGEAEEEGGEKEPKEPSPLQLSVVLENVTIVRVDGTKAEGDRETRIEDLDLTLTLEGRSADDLSGALTATVARIVTEQGLATENVTLSAKGEKGAWILEKVELPVNGGQVTAKGDVNLAEGRAFKIEAAVTDVQLAKGFPLLAYALPILQIGADGEAEGTLSATLHAQGKGFDLESLKQTLQGGGDIRLMNGEVRGNAILSQAMALAGKSGSWSFEELGTTFRIDAGRVHADPMKLGGGNVKLKLEGSVGLDGQVDYVLGVKPKGSSWKGVREALGEGGFVPIRVTGSLGDLKVEEPNPADLLKKILEDKVGGKIGDLIGR